jgi:hypothetical protein
MIQTVSQIGVFFVIGPPRTGSSLVARIISDHPLAHCWYETRLVREVHGVGPDNRDRYMEANGFGEGRFGSRLALDLRLDGENDEKIATWLRESVHAAQIIYGKPRVCLVGEKDTHYTLSDEALAEALWAGPCIFTTRAIEAIRKTDRVGWGETCAGHYRKAWKAIQPHRGHPNLLIIAYEELTRDPDSYVRTIYDHLDLPWDETWKDRPAQPHDERWSFNPKVLGPIVAAEPVVIDQEELDERVQDATAPTAMTLWRADGREANLNGLYNGRACFLCCGGPSLATFNLDLLSQRGIVSMAVNNAWSVFRPDLWLSVDPAWKFVDAGWKDPGILKFVPLARKHDRLRTKKDGEFVDLKARVRQMPGVFYYKGNTRFRSDRFLVEPSVSWGCGEDVADDLGFTGGRSCTLAALRILHYLGFRRVYLVGADFAMDAEQPYAFGQKAGKGAADGNNGTYEVLEARFHALAPRFKRAGFKVWNCTPDSNLNAFPVLDYSEALDRERIGGEIDAEGWYEAVEASDSTQRAQRQDAEIAEEVV